jgi:hypothetical protein
VIAEAGLDGERKGIPGRSQRHECRGPEAAEGLRYCWRDVSVRGAITKINKEERGGMVEGRGACISKCDG